MRLKVLILTNLFPSAWDPQRAAFNRQQFERLARVHDVEVMTAIDFRDRLRGPRGDPRLGDLKTGDFTFWYPPAIGRSLHALCWFASLVVQHGRRLRAARYDCLLASWAYPDAVAVARLARWLKLPYAVKVHGSDLNVQAGFALRRRQIASALSGAGAVIAVSRALAEKAVELGVETARVHTIYNGVDSERFAPGPQSEARQRLGAAADQRIVLYVGNLKPAKGCVDLLEAFPAVRAAVPGTQLVYIGAGSAREALAARAASLGVAADVRLLGALAHEEIADWFRAADLLCLPSHNEGVPNVVLEAMACGTPVVATRVGGIPEVVPESAGILVPAKAVDALAQALVEALGRSWDRSRIAEHARGFRWDDNIRQLSGILESVAAEHATTPARKPA